MPEIFIPARGCVYNPRKTRAGSGFYALEPALRGNAESPILIDGIDSTDQDIIFPVTTLDEKKYLYVQGEDFGNVTISGVALLGKAEQGGRAFATIVSYFNAHRVNRGMVPIAVSFPGSVSQKVYLTAIVVAKPDPEFHIQPFMFRGIVAEPKKA
jgi:hypothetical protein